MEAQMPDSAISEQDPDTTTVTTGGLAADGQEAGRIRGMMSLVGKRTSERDAAIAERDRLREQLAALQAEEPAEDGPGAEPHDEQLRESTDELDEDQQAQTEPQATASNAAPTEYELPVGSIITMPDGSQYLVGSAGPGTIASNTPMRSTAGPTTEVEQLRAKFAAELPGYVAEMQDRALLRGR